MSDHNEQTADLQLEADVLVIGRANSLSQDEKEYQCHDAAIAAL
jgi:hypothetical protein